MISDSVPNASVALASSNPKDFAKKKRANRTAKLKQCKLDARREQWLSQVKSKGGCKEDVNDEEGACGDRRGLDNTRSKPMEKLEIKPRFKEEGYTDGMSMHHFSDSKSSPSSSPIISILGSNNSGCNFTESSSRSSSSSGRSSSCSTNCFSSSMSEEDEGGIDDDGCLDDWETMADALAATEDKQQEHSPNTGFGLPVKNHGNTLQCGSQLNLPKQLSCGNGILDAKHESGGKPVQRNGQAWRVNDAFRPQSLPNLSKQYSFPLNSDRHFGSGGSVWGKNLGPVPTSCPICYEDLDCTDSSFMPCQCGFRLCLFCHKRILEEDGRCPGCRKHYNCGPSEGEATLIGGSSTVRLARCCSMITRS